MTTAAGFAFLHLGHADAATDGTGVVTALAAVPLAVYMGVMAENGVAFLDAVGDGTGDTTVALAAILLRCDTERLFAVMAGTAGLALLHFCHGVAAFLCKVVNGIVAGLAVSVLQQVRVMAEDNGGSILEAVLDLLGLYCKWQQRDDNGCQIADNPPLHQSPPLRLVEF